MNAKEQLEKMVGSDLMAGLPEMTGRLEATGQPETADGINDTAMKPEVLAVDVMYEKTENKLRADVWIYFGKSPEFSVVQVELLQDGISIAKKYAGRYSGCG